MALIGSNGVKPRFAANLGTFGFHLGPNNCEFLNLIFDLLYHSIQANVTHDITRINTKRV